jgi:hypothetical protein
MSVSTGASDFAQWLEQTPAGVMVRESLWGFQIVVALHILSLAFSVGLLVWFDLRLVGLGVKSSRVMSVYRQLIPWASAGFVMSFITGGLLLMGFAVAAVGNPFFWSKMLLIGAAGVNAAFYHRVTARDVGDVGNVGNVGNGTSCDVDPRPTGAARAAGLISIAAWTLVVLCGRMMSYTMF